jgi:NitT/TauT family transport system permease protein
VAWIVGIAVAFVLAWKAYSESLSETSQHFILPPPDEVWRALVRLAGESRTWEHAWITTREILYGFAAAAVFGIVTGVVLGEFPAASRVVNPYLVTLQVLPKVAVIPLLFVWLDFGTSTRVVIAAVFAFFPMTASTRAGIRSVDPGHLDLAATLQMSRLRRLWLVELRAALPSIVTGMEVAIVLATVGALVAEYLSPGEGLGWLAINSLNQLRVDDLFAIIVLLSALGVLLYAAVASLRRVLVPWHASAADRPPGM